MTFVWIKVKFVRVHKITMLDAEIMQIKSNNRQCKYASALLCILCFEL